MQKIHVPLFLGGLNYIPPASGTNYGSWAVVGLIFGLLVKRKYTTWWKRYNFVLSSALDCSVAIAGIFIFFTVLYTGASKNLKWWGTEVHKVRYHKQLCVTMESKTNILPRKLAIGRAVVTRGVPGLRTEHAQSNANMYMP